MFALTLFLKRNVSYLSIAALGLLGGLSPSLARSQPLLNLEQTVILALTHNQDLQLSANQVRDGEVSVRLQRDQFLPGLSGGSSATLRHDEGALDGDRNYDIWSADVAMNLNLFNGFGDQAALAAARQSLAARQHAFGRQEQSLVFETIGNYLEAVKTLEQIGVAEQAVQDNEQQLAAIEAYYRAGSRPITDVYLQKAETARARSALLNARRDYQVSMLSLQQTIGIDALARAEVALPDHPLLKTVPSLDASTLVEDARQKRLDLLALQKEVAAAGEQVRVAKAGRYPALELLASAGTSYDGRNSVHFGRQMSQDNFNASVGLSLSVPIFDRNLSRHQERQALIGSSSAQIEVIRLKRRIEVEIGQSVADYRTAEEQLAVAEAQLTYAKNALASSEKRYQVGAATLTELTNARSVYVEARYARIEAEIGCMMQAVAIAYYSGSLDPGLFFRTDHS
ncbi:MAG: TolC family protein [Syntrophotaleaceae bacterium]